MITIDDKKYDEAKLSDEGKAALSNIQGINQKQNNLRVEFSHNEILLKHYIDILTNNLPDKVREETKKK